jgi:2'-5' RNA ligase
MDSIRAFIAIDLPEDIRRELRRLTDRLEAAMNGVPVRWVRPEAIHLTLRFLGDTGLELVSELERDLEGIGRGNQAFSIIVGGLGCFPNLRRPRVLWVGVQEESGTLKHLQQGVENMCRRLGFSPEKRGFSPHLTLGRVRQGGESRVAEAFGRFIESEHVAALGQATVEEIVLFQSELKPDGAVYRRLASARLNSR